MFRPLLDGRGSFGIGSDGDGFDVLVDDDFCGGFFDDFFSGDAWCEFCDDEAVALFAELHHAEVCDEHVDAVSAGEWECALWDDF